MTFYFASLCLLYLFRNIFDMGSPHYHNPAGIIAGSVIMEIFSALCVGLRFYTQLWKQQKILTSDWLVLAAIVLATGLTVVEIYGQCWFCSRASIISTYIWQVLLSKHLHIH